MSEINDELIQKARNADLADYFLRNGYDCEMKSKNELHLVQVRIQNLSFIF